MNKLLIKAIEDYEHISYVQDLLEDTHQILKTRLKEFPKYKFKDTGEIIPNPSNEDDFLLEGMAICLRLSEGLARLYEMGILYKPE